MIFLTKLKFFPIKVFTINDGVGLYVGALIFDEIDQLSSICLRKTVNVSRLLNDQALQFE